MTGPLLTVVVPCYNERDTIREIVAAVLAAEPADKEVIVVDDGSSDGTRAILDSEIRALDPRVRVILHEKNQGKGAALRTGFAQATGRIVIVQDADLEYDPNDHAKVIAPILEDIADVVYGSRFQGGQPHRVVFFWHMVGNRMLTLLSNMMTNLTLTDMETCSKAFRREVLADITIEEDRFGFEPEITAKIAVRGWRIYEVGIAYRGRTYAAGKKIGWKDGVSAMRCIVGYNVRERIAGRRAR